MSSSELDPPELAIPAWARRLSADEWDDADEDGDPDDAELAERLPRRGRRRRRPPPRRN